MKKIYYKTVEVNGVNIAYRETGDINKPTIVLLHGYPSSSHQYRKILNRLSDEYHLIAPDYPGFGNSDFPSPDAYEYTFDNIATTIEEGLGEAWAPIRELWANRNERTEKALLPAFTLEGLKWQYTHGTKNAENVNPDTWHLDYLRMTRPNAHKVNIDLWYDYQNNLKLYPHWQRYLRKHQPPMLIVWGKNDEYFPESGAEAFKKDVDNIDYNIYDTGHFALEEHGDEIIEKIRAFMERL